MSEENLTFTLHLRGMPYSATRETIIEFLKTSEEHITALDIIMNSQGKASGEAYVAMNNQVAAESALEQHKQTFPGSTRWVEVFKSTEQKRMAGGTSSGQTWDGVVKARGLPFEATPQDVENFFQGLTHRSIFVPRNANGKASGEAYIQFDTYTSANNALALNKSEMNGRYIELFKSSNSELRRSMITDLKARFGNGMNQGGPSSFGGLNLQGGGPMRQAGFGGQRQGPYDRPAQQQPQQNGGGAFYGGAPGGAAPAPQAAVKQETPATSKPANSPFAHCVAMTGLPQGLSNQAVQEFFKPNRAIALNMNSGTGSGIIAFKTHTDAVSAMNKNGQPLMGMAVSLTLKSEPPAAENSHMGFTMC